MEQTKANHDFLFELSNAWSWQMHVIIEVAPLEGVQIVQGHMCAYGLQVKNTECAKLVRMPTGWMTKSSCSAVAASHRCSNER